MTGPQPKEALLEVLTGQLASSGLDLEGVEISPAGRRRLVRILVDKDGGVTLDDIAAATTLVSAWLDASDVLGESPYTLEVTSPGTDRPLTLPRHWSRNLDRLVMVRPLDGPEVVGRIVDVGQDSASIDVSGTTQEIRYGDVATARIQIEFNRPRAASRAAATAKSTEEE